MRYRRRTHLRVRLYGTTGKGHSYSHAYLLALARMFKAMAL